jgi:cell division septal protein FtsQ
MTGRGDGRRPAPAPAPARPGPTRPGIRTGPGGRRTRRQRRASAGLTPVRAGALLALLAGLAGLYGLVSSSAFTARHTEITGATWTPEDTILAALAIPAGQNVFAVNSTALANRLSGIPAIRGARVTVALPDQIQVAVTEREALVAWQVASHRYLVDATGLLFAELGDNPSPAAASLPVVEDRRSVATTLGVGTSLDPVTLDAALRLGSLTPAELGSGATSLAIRLDDTDGFTVQAQPTGWTAVFGFYTPTLRTTDLIPGQVRLLRSLLFDREAQVQRIVLADDRSGTFVPRASASPSPSATPRPSRTPKPTPKPTPRPTATAKPATSPRPSASTGP